MTDELARKLREALELEEAERQRLAEEEDKRIRDGSRPPTACLNKFMKRAAGVQGIQLHSDVI